MTYNANGRVTQIDNNGTPTGPTVVLDLTYDNLSRLTSQAATVSSTADFLNSYTYNAASQLTKITQQSQSGGNSVASKRIDLTYTTTGQLSTVDRYANLAGSQLVATSTWGYDAKGQATSLTDAQGATTLASYTWSYDRIGRLTGDSINSVADTFTYDASGQITAVTHNGSGTEAYSYDANGNRTGGGHTTTTNNQLTSDSTYNYTYDNEGNLTRKTTISGGAFLSANLFHCQFHSGAPGANYHRGEKQHNQAIDNDEERPPAPT